MQRAAHYFKYNADKNYTDTTQYTELYSQRFGMKYILPSKFGSLTTA